MYNMRTLDIKHKIRYKNQYQYKVYDDLFKGEFKLHVMGDDTYISCESVGKFKVEEETSHFDPIDFDSVLSFIYKNGHKKKSVCVDTEEKCKNNPRIRTKSAIPGKSFAGGVLRGILVLEPK